MMILARKDFAPRTFAELVAYAKANKEKFTVASVRHGQRHASLRHAVPGGDRHAAHHGAVQGRRRRR